jgi:WD40 repeat protein
VAHEGGVLSVAFSGDGKTLATGGKGSKLRLWDPATGQPRGDPIEAHEGAVFAIAFSADGKTLATGGFDGNLRFWRAVSPYAEGTATASGSPAG